MGQPTPPGDIPLIEGLDSGWNDIVNYIPEDKRSEFAPILKERLSSYESLKPYEDFAKSGVAPDHLKTALDVFSVIENNPRQVYETLGKHLNITPQQAQQVVETVQENATNGNATPSELETIKKQVETLGQLMLAQRDMTNQEKAMAEQEAALDREIKAVKQKYGDIPEDQLIMRMVAKEISADQAAQEYLSMVSEIQKRRPAPFVLGSGGQIPAKQIDVTKLDSASTKNLVAQMMMHGNQERDT